MGLSFSQQGATPGQTFSILNPRHKPVNNNPGNTNATGSLSGAGQGVNLTGLLPSGGSNNVQQSSGSPIPGVDFSGAANFAPKPTPGLYGASNPQVKNGLTGSTGIIDRTTTQPTPVQAPTTQGTMKPSVNGASSTNTGTTGGTGTASTGGAGMGMMGGGQAQAQTPQGPQPGTPGYYAQNLSNLGQKEADLQKAFIPVKGTARNMPGTYGNYGQNLYNFNSDLLNAQMAPLQSQVDIQKNLLDKSQSQPYSPTNVPFNQITGQYGQPAATAYGAGGLAGVGAILQQQQQGADTQTMIGAYNQAKPLIESAKQQIAAAGFNSSPLALANQLQQYINKDVIPSGEYANIFNTLSEIATTISPVLGAQGNQTNLKTMLAQEFLPLLMQGKDLNSVFDTIETNSLAKITANKGTSTGTPLNVPPGNTGDFNGATNGGLF